jgi:hypothetical protein
VGGPRGLMLGTLLRRASWAIEDALALADGLASTGPVDRVDISRILDRRFTADDRYRQYACMDYELCACDAVRGFLEERG